MSAQLGDVTSDYNSMLGKKPADLIDKSGSASDQAAADPVDGLQRQLLGRFHRNEAHVRPTNRFAYRFGGVLVVLVRFDVRRHELGADQPDVMTKL
jgi:hypothetical protein